MLKRMTDSGKPDSGIRRRRWIVTLKDENPTLADIEQDPKVNDAIGKIKEMQDPKEAVKTSRRIVFVATADELKVSERSAIKFKSPFLFLPFM